MEEEWFLKNKSKQHSLIHITIAQLRKEISYLKEIGVFHFMIKIFEDKVNRGIYTEKDVSGILDAYVKAGLIPESFQANIDARRKVRSFLCGLALPADIKIPVIKDFLIMDETGYFKFLVTNFKNFLLNKIKDQYDGIMKGFFR